MPAMEVSFASSLCGESAGELHVIEPHFQVSYLSASAIYGECVLNLCRWDPSLLLYWCIQKTSIFSGLLMVQKTSQYLLPKAKGCGGTVFHLS